MIYSYGVSLPGTYHIKNDIVCQDSHKIIHCGKEAVIAAVADGLGSAEHSDEGAQIAADVATEHCRQFINEKADETEILDIIRDAFSVALVAVENEAASKDRTSDKYDTTLTLTVLIRDALYFGHSGDSGVIALTANGFYEQVTIQQRDDEGRVFPLFFEDRWEFAKFESKVSAVMLATDGMLETFFPIYIKNDPVNIHVSLAHFFMDYRGLRINKIGSDAIQAQMSDFIENIPDEQISDDKTIVVLLNSSVKTKRQPESYYQEPDWDELRKKHDEAWKREAYPGLFGAEDAEAEKDAPNGEQDEDIASNIEPHDKPRLLDIFRRKCRSKR